MTTAVAETEATPALSPEQERLNADTLELLENIVGPGNVTPRLLDLYWKTKWALDRQNGGRLSPETLAVVCALSGAVTYTRPPGG